MSTEATTDAPRSSSEEALADAEESYKVLFESNPLPMWVFDWETLAFLAVNSAAIRHYGYLREEFLSMTVLDIRPPEDRDAFLSALSSGKGVDSCRWRHVKKDGQIIEVQLTTRGLSWAGRRARLVVVNDITERLRAEDLLRKSEEKYRELIENANDIIYSHDLEGRFTSLNKAAERLSGYTTDEALVLTLDDIIVPAYLEVARENLNRKLSGDPTPPYEIEILTKDGRQLLLEVSTRLINHDGKPVGVQGIGRDITERRKAQQSLAMQASVLESMVEGVSVADEEGFISYINPAMDAMFGYKPGELIGKHVSVLNTYPPEENQRIVARIIERLKREGSWAGEFSNRKKDGTLFPTSARITAIEISGKKYWVSVQEDITERKRAEKIQLATYKISDAAGTADSLQALFRSIHETLGELLPVPNLYIALYDEPSRTFSFPYFADERSSRPAKRRLGRGLTEYTFHLGAPLHAPPDVRGEIMRSGRAELSGSPSTDWFGVPLKIRDKAIGVLVVQSYTEGVTFAEDERNVLVYVSEQIAMAIDRKRAEEERSRLLDLERAARHEAEQLTTLSSEMLLNERAARAQAEDLQREWQATFDAMADIVMLIDRDDKLIRANRAFFRTLDLTPEECVGRSASDLLHRRQGTVKSDECPVCELRRKGERTVVELPAGSVTDYPLFVSLDPIADGDGNITAVVQVIRDLSDLYSAREQAEQVSTSLNATIEQMGEGFMVFDNSCRLVRANRHAQRLFGLALEQMRHVTDLSGFTDEEGRAIEPDDLPVETALREQRIVERQLWYDRADRHRTLLSVTASPFFTDRNRLAGAIAILRDVTEREREHERLQQADKLRALGQLASGVAHNFNNSLAAVIGYTQLALPKVKGRDVERYLRVVEQSAKDAARMVERIQNFSRASAREGRLPSVRLSDTVRDAIDITRPRWLNDAQSLGIKYDLKLVWRSEEDLRVSGDASELREVFVNVIFNALDAMPTGGTLNITADSSASEVSVTFIDTGVGMTEEIKRRIFEPFFTTKGVGGLGMGLSESYRIVERHRGRIEVEGQLHRGATFTITLPLLQSADGTTHLEAVTIPTSPARVLVVDDEEAVRDVLAEILLDQGHNVALASSAQEAQDLVENEDFDVVFTDLAMPKTDGVTAAAEIKSRKPRTKVVLMSGYGAERAYEREGGCDFIDASISKPFSMDEIHKAMRDLLGP